MLVTQESILKYQNLRVELIPLYSSRNLSIHASTDLTNSACNSFETDMQQQANLYIMKISFCTPQRANALTYKVLQEGIEIFDVLRQSKNIRLLLIAGEGRHFCAGMDLNWVQSRESSYENIAQILQQFFKKLYDIPIPKVAIVQGTCAGGGMGIISICDSVIAHEASSFILSEIKLGLVPAIIMPYLAQVLSHAKLKRYALTGVSISAHAALQDGLCHHIYHHDLDEILTQELRHYLHSSWMAQTMIYEMLHTHVSSQFVDYNATATFVSALQTSDAKEGLQAFSKKTQSSWQELQIAPLDIQNIIKSYKTS